MVRAIAFSAFLFVSTLFSAFALLGLSTFDWHSLCEWLLLVKLNHSYTRGKHNHATQARTENRRFNLRFNRIFYHNRRRSTELRRNHRSSAKYR